jgi:Ser/Thr protein kinase RdoA (MazF antagonist)
VSPRPPPGADLVRAALGWTGEVQWLRAGTRPVVRVAGAGVVKAFAEDEAAEAARQADAATALADAGVPVVRPLSSVVQAGGWVLVPLPDLPFPLSDEPGPWRGFGAALAALHRVGATTGVRAPPWAPLALLETWLAAAPDVALAAAVRRRAGPLARALPDGEELLHTDPHAGNVRIDADGRVVLIDLDGLARGDGRYDLGVVEATERRHRGRTDTLGWLLEGYDVSPTRLAADDPAIRLAAALREVLSIGWLVGRAEAGALSLARARLDDLALGRDGLWAGL